MPELSVKGRCKPNAERFWPKVDVRSENECWEWQGKVCKRTGYGHFTVYTVDGHKSLGAHRFSFELANGAPTAGMNVLHSCDNRRCVNPKHLSEGTQSQNLVEMVERGRCPRNNAQLTDEQVIDLRQRYAAGEEITKLVDEFGFHHGTITRICGGKTYPHVGGPLSRRPCGRRPKNL